MDLLLAVASFLSPAKASVLLQLVDRMVRQYTRGGTSLAAACQTPPCHVAPPPAPPQQPYSPRLARCRHKLDPTATSTRAVSTLASWPSRGTRHRSSPTSTTPCTTLEPRATLTRHISCEQDPADRQRRHLAGRAPGSRQLTHDFIRRECKVLCTLQSSEPWPDTLTAWGVGTTVSFYWVNTRPDST